MDMFEQAAQQRDTHLLSETLVELSRDPKWKSIVNELIYLRSHIQEVRDAYSKARIGESNEINTKLMLIYSDQIFDIECRMTYLERILYKQEDKLNRVGILKKLFRRNEIESLNNLLADVEI